MSLKYIIVTFVIFAVPNASSFILPTSLPTQYPSIQIISRPTILTATRGEHDNIKDTTSRKKKSYPSSTPIIGSTTFYDEDEECAVDSCLLNEHFSDSDSSTSVSIVEKYILDPLFIIPIISPILAYITYDDIARLFAAFIDFLSFERNWVPVDGGAYQARIIAPAINGIVVPSVSILFATLISNTVATLRQRQIDIHTSLNTEAGDLRLLSGMVESFPQCDQKNKCKEYLTQYTSRLIAESSDDVKFNSMESLGSTDSEMNGFTFVLNELATLGGGGKEGEERFTVHGALLSEAYGAVVRLNSQRSARITYLQSTFPTLHFAILSALGGSISLAFLIETNQELLIFLNAIQLRILWTMLVGTFSALAVVCYDLSGPFRGQYQISNAVYQLMTIRDALKASRNKVNENI
jgi:hypothetical protein